MSVLGVQVIEAPNLSVAWGRAFLTAAAATPATTAPMVISVGGFDNELPEENPTIRSAVDEFLSRTDKNPVRVSAMTIFPWEMWVRRGRPGSADFCPLCVDKLAPRLKGRDARNRLGIYFERMMAFEGLKGGDTRVVNQLQFVIDLLNRDRMPRRSALQLACFDPAKDHTGQPVRGFPCLQQVSVTHDGDNELGIHAFYPTQYIFDRGYGNYLGLCHLGAFIAHETGMRFRRLNCFVGWPELGDVNKADVSGLVDVVRDELQTRVPEGANP
jgi:hypothetical protein